MRVLRLGGIAETVQVTGEGQPREKSGPPQRLRIGGNVQAAKLVQKLIPQYPEEAKRQGIQGAVQLQAILSPAGDVALLTVLDSPSNC